MMTGLPCLFVLLSRLVMADQSDNDMFSSISEMSKLAVLEKDYTQKLNDLVKIIELKKEVLEKIMMFKMFSSKDHYNSTINPIKQVLKISDEEAVLRQQIKEGFKTLPQQKELEGAGNGEENEKYKRYIFISYIFRFVSTARNIQAQCDSLL